MDDGGNRMNLIETALKKAVQNAIKKAFDTDIELDEIVVEEPKSKEHGDYATNVAMRLTKVLRMNPKAIAEKLLLEIDNPAGGIRKAEIAGPGFINFFMDAQSLSEVIGNVIAEDLHYGQTVCEDKRKWNVEYVSANPTGDLHPGHARGASAGDSLTRIMKTAGYDVTREYYINDAGNQINNMAKSLQARYLQRFGVDIVVPEDGYHGKDLIEIAETVIAEVGDAYKDRDLEESLPFFRTIGLREETKKLRDDLLAFNVEFDVWTSEQSIYDRGLVERALKQLTDNGNTYVSEDATWLRTTEFGDDKDRVLVRGNGLYTYLLPDIAYHLNKKDRGFDVLIDLLGADHHGYIARLKAAIQALGYPSSDLEVDIIQMARMIKDGEEFKMSKRTGKAVSLKDLIEAAGVDAVRYYFVSRAGDTHMDLDLDMASKQSNENPVYYAQYAHARMCSILRNAEAQPASSFELIVHPKETELCKIMFDFPQMIKDAAQTRQPHKVCNYIQKLAAAFHAFYNECQVLNLEDARLSAQRLGLVKAVQITLRNALTLIGVSAPEKM
jgi:arginyl-tRNA synthetase